MTRVYAIALLICISWLYTSYALKNGTTLVLGLSTTRNSSANVWNARGYALFKGIEFWANRVNAAGGIRVAGTNYSVALRVFYDDGVAASIISNYQILTEDPEIDYLFGPFGSTISLEVAKVTEAAKKLLMGVVVSNDEFSQIGQHSFGVMPQISRYSHVTMPFFRTQRLTSVTYLIKDDHGALACDGFTDIGLENGILNITSFSLASSDAPDHEKNWTDTLNAVIQTNSDILFSCGSVPQSAFAFMLPLMKSRDWIPKAIVVMPFVWSFLDPTLRDYISGVKGPGLNSRRVGDLYGTIQDFSNIFGAAYPEVSTESHVGSAIATMSGTVLQKALEGADSIDTYDVISSLKKLDLNTFLGRIRYSPKNEQLSDGVMSQLINGSEVVVGPLLSASADLIIPMPTWKERVFKETFGDSIFEWVVLAIVGIAFVFTLAFGVYIIAYKDKLKYSSPLFMLGILIGANLIYFSTLFATPNNSQTFSCHIHNWLFFLGVNLMFGCLFAKSWRVYYIYRAAKTLEPIRVSDLQVATYVGVFCSVCIVLCIAFSAVLEPSKYVVVDQHRISKNYYECELSTAGHVVLGIQHFAIIVTMLIGTVTAFLLRKVPLNVFNEAKVIGYSIYNMTLFTVVATISFYTITSPSAREQKYAIYSICIVLSAGICVLAMFVLDNSKEATKKKSNINSVQSLNSQLDDIDDEKRVASIEAQIEHLKGLIENVKDSRTSLK